MVDTTDNRGPNMKHIMQQEQLRELEATCEGLDSYAAVCVANVQRLEAEIEKLSIKYKNSEEYYHDQLAEAREEIARLNKLYYEWGFKDAPCPKHCKEPILAENNCASCYAEICDAKIARLRKALELYVGKFGNCGDVYDQAKQALEASDGI